MQLNDLLSRHDIDPDTVLVLRHRPPEPELRKILPRLAVERPAVFNAYQQTQQDPKTESAMQRAEFVASFIGHCPGKAIFVGLYRRGASRALDFGQYWSRAEYIEMKAFGIRGFVAGSRPSVLWFDLDPTDFYAQWKGRLIVAWPAPEKSWYRWAGRNELHVESILEKNGLEPELPDWRRLTVSWGEIKLMPESWRAALAQWRGIYFVLDAGDGLGYVGSACGTQNILGRWLEYATTGHGGNVRFRGRDPSRFRFSILERLAPDLPPEEVQRIEAGWKERLHTREFGLNKN